MVESGSIWTPLARTYDPIQCGNIDGTEKDVHDKGIWRAVSATYKPNKGVTGDKDCTLFVGRLSLKTEESTLRKIFEKYGDIKRMRIVRDLVTGYSKGYAFIEFEAASQVKLAHSHTNRIFVDGVRIIVEFEHERSMKGWVPRRLGGGFGGKKESGQLRFGCRERPFLKPYNAQQRHYVPVGDGQHHHRDRQTGNKPYTKGYRTGNRPSSREESRSKPYDRYHRERRR